MKMSIIGGGGVRSLFLAKSVAGCAEELNISQIVFMDTDELKLGIYGKMAKKVCSLICPSLKVDITSDKIEAVRDADYIITTIREGGDSMRIRDERIALSLGLLGQETTGAAGFSFALRSIPALLEYCELAKKYAAKDAKIFNFTNPCGIVSQALCDAGYTNTFGICDAPSGMARQFAAYLNADIDKLETKLYGLNHLSFFSSVKLDGKQKINGIISDDRAYETTDLRYFGKNLVKDIGQIPNEYLYYYFYAEKAVANILSAGETRGECIGRINVLMTEELSKIDVENEFDKALSIFEKYYGMRENAYMKEETGVSRDKKWKFELFGKDDGGYAGVALSYIKKQNLSAGGEMILCVPNNGAIDGLSDSDVVEISCNIRNGECLPIKAENTNVYAMELIKRVKAYERAASEAILTKNKRKAVWALYMHPLIASYSLAEKLCQEYFALNEKYLKRWN